VGQVYSSLRACSQNLGGNPARTGLKHETPGNVADDAFGCFGYTVMMLSVRTLVSRLGRAMLWFTAVVLFNLTAEVTAVVLFNLTAEVWLTVI
jgi:hypothetical protein